MGRSRDRADRIKEQIPIVQVLYDLGYQVHPQGGDREQQFQCNLHGDGTDNKPSARVYPRSASFYCFACGETRDAIKTIQDKEGLNFHDACTYLEKKYGLPPLPWEPQEKEETVEDRVSAVFSKGVSFAEGITRIDGLLTTLTKEKDLPMNRILTFWEVRDMVCYMVAQDQWDEAKGRKAINKLHKTVMDSFHS